jgi:pantetheine-phosphate adenylyltransferase
MPKIAVFPGSFDPITIGHTNIVERALPLFDTIIIGVGNNSQKQYLFSTEKRTKWIEKIFAKEKSVSVQAFSGLTVEFCKKNNANFILRGLRSAADFEYESLIAQANQAMTGIETVFLLSKPEYSAISSTVIRDVIRNGGDASKFLPEMISGEVKR